MKITPELIHALPKTDLHCHLDGSLRLTTILDLAKQQQVTLPASTEEGLLPYVYAGPECASLVEYLRAFDTTLSVLQTEEALFRVAYELAEDCAKENVRYFEVRYAPVLHTQKGLSLSTIVEAVLRGLKQAEDDFGIQSGVILCGIRSFSKESSLETAKLCVEYKHKGVVAFDLAGAELGHPPMEHQEALDLIHKNYLSCTIHAGEADGASSVVNALFAGHAHRIGHGTRIYEDPGLVDYIRDHQIPLEICPSSNVQTKAIPSLAKHPLYDYYRKGLVVTINTDNRLVTNTTITQELWLCHKQFGFSLDELKQLIRNGVQSGFLPQPQKKALLARVEAELAQFS